MHRSGTSALAGMLELFNFDLGKNLMPPSSDNSKGYFENSAVSAANDRLLEHLGVNWAKPYLLAFNELFVEHIPGAFLEEFKRLIVNEFSSGKNILIKDPRLCVLLPFWKIVFAELNLQPVYLLISRNPEEVKESLRNRDFLSQTESEKLWLYYNLCAELYTRGEKRLFVSCEEMLDSPVQTIRKISKILPFLSDEIFTKEKSITQFIEPGLRHHNDPGVSSLNFEKTKILFQLLKRASDEVIPQDLEQNADEIRLSLERNDIFKTWHSGENECRAKLLYNDGTCEVHTQRTSTGIFRLELKADPLKSCRKVFFHVCDDHCAVLIDSVKLIDHNGQFITADKLYSNATFKRNSLYIFAHPVPFIYFFIPEGFKLNRIEISVSYEVIGEKTDQMLQTAGLNILYILRSFPTVTEMSTLNEITGMIRRGVEVSIVSLKKPADMKHLHDDIEKYRLTERTFYLNVSTGIKKWRNILLRTIYGQVKLYLFAKLPLKNKIEVSVYSIRKKSRRLSLVHLVDLINHIAIKKPNVIYFHFATHAGELIILRKIFNMPVVVFFHGFDFSKNLPFKDLNYPQMFRKGDWFFTNSSFSAQKVRELGCPAGKLSVPGLPVDDINYPYKIRILTVARLVEKKGLYYAILAFSECHKKFPELEYEIVGEGPLREELTRLVKSMGMQDHIRLSGNKTKDQVIETMLDSDIFILTSITADDGETEGLGMVLLESQLTGMPVLATRHNGFTDAVKDGISGFLVPEKDVAAIADKLTWMMDHPESWAAMGAAGRQHIMDNFREQVYLDRILSRLYEIRKKF
jgi:colanic acid/amylovoran biosynthesis glycosyltransferase